MTVKRTLNEIVEVMLNNGVSLSSIKDILLDLGFPEEKVAKVIEAYKFMEQTTSTLANEKNANGNSSNDQSIDDKQIQERADMLAIEEEIKRHKETLSKIEDELMKLIVDMGEVKKRLRTLEETRASRSIEEDIKDLKAKLDALIDVLIDKAPIILEELRRRGLK